MTAPSTTGGSDRSVVWVGGSLADPATASVHWSDHGLTVGDGVFETIELRDGAPFALTRHLSRLDRSAEGLGLRTPPRAAVTTAVDAVARDWGREPGRLRITYTGGPGPMGSNRADATPTLIVAAAPMRDPDRTRRSDRRARSCQFTVSAISERGGPGRPQRETTSYGEHVLAGGGGGGGSWP